MSEDKEIWFDRRGGPKRYAIKRGEKNIGTLFYSQYHQAWFATLNSGYSTKTLWEHKYATDKEFIIKEIKKAVAMLVRRELIL